MKLGSGLMEQSIARIASTIADYRQLGLDAAHVRRWATQFSPEVRATILAETAHLLDQTYVSLASATTFARGLARNPKLVGSDPVAFWNATHLIRAGNNNRSQNDLLRLTTDALATEGLSARASIAGASQFVYVDDGIFTGNQLLYALKNWIQSNSISNCGIHVIVLGLHTGGHWYANKQLRASFSQQGVTFQWWRILEITSGVNNPKESQILWPATLPNTPEATAWVTANLGKGDFIPRPPNGGTSTSFFSSESARNTIEQEFFQQGCRLIGFARSPIPQMRPLGFTKLRTPGLGTMFATYRNCPNNAPLVMWWGDPNEGHPLNQWYPLLPRLM